MHRVKNFVPRLKAKSPSHKQLFPPTKLNCKIGQLYLIFCENEKSHWIFFTGFDSQSTQFSSLFISKILFMIRFKTSLSRVGRRNEVHQLFSLLHRLSGLSWNVPLRYQIMGMGVGNLWVFLLKIQKFTWI